MVKYAYNKTYLNDAQDSLSAMLDYAVYSLHYELSFFYNMFLQSSVADKFASGDAGTIAGKTGIELARQVVYEHTNEECMVPHVPSFEKSPEYWAGWALAYYQWNSGLSFELINQEVPINDICAMYYKYHEMDIVHFVEHMDELRMNYRCMTYLKKLRQHAGLSQKELAIRADIPVKTIQQYEQRQKNINKAQVESIIKLSRVLCCSPEDLLE